MAMPVPIGKYRAGLVLRYLAPSVTFSNGINPNDLAVDQQVGERYSQDPLVHDKISVRLFFDIANTSAMVMKKAELIEIPVLIGHGAHDRIISISGSEKLAKRIPKSTLQTWKGSAHESHNDVEKQEVIRRYIEWIKGIIKKP